MTGDYHAVSAEYPLVPSKVLHLAGATALYENYIASHENVDV